jgi:uncharacterized protein with FMN-binding domain
MKKFLLSASLVVVFAIYVMQGKSNDVVVTTPPAILGDNSNSQPGAPTPTPMTTPQPTTPTPAPTPSVPAKPKPTSSAYQDGVYTGSLADAYFGNVQVQATIQSGRLTDVQFLTYPNDNRHSLEVSNTSLPILRSEAIQSQSAKVDIVSGATQTSQAFEQSLANALNRAKA